MSNESNTEDIEALVERQIDEEIAKEDPRIAELRKCVLLGRCAVKGLSKKLARQYAGGATDGSADDVWRNAKVLAIEYALVEEQQRLEVALRLYQEASFSKGVAAIFSAALATSTGPKGVAN